MSTFENGIVNQEVGRALAVGEIQGLGMDPATVEPVIDLFVHLMQRTDNRAQRAGAQKMLTFLRNEGALTGQIVYQGHPCDDHMAASLAVQRVESCAEQERRWDANGAEITTPRSGAV